MYHLEIATPARTRSAVAHLPNERHANLVRLMTAAVPALGILAACAATLIAIL
ncbi:MAG TPA: hypothetical protein PK286_01770 [Devosia sp.]|nr:hypothetical protein [Devosia sp.]